MDQPPTSHRGPVTAHEADVLRSLAQNLESADSRFFCGGTVAIGTDNPVLFYGAHVQSEPSRTADNLLAKYIPLNGDQALLAQLHDSCSPSHHGEGSKTVYDESYRLARELKPDEFGLNFDPLHPTNGILDAVAAACNAEVCAKLYNLNCYAKGGFFKPHKDTPKSEDHLGTIVMLLPSSFEGGELTLSHGNRTVKLDWSAANHEPRMSLQWAFFFSDVLHEILPVTSGFRLTLAYDVFRYDNAARSHARSAIVAEHTPLFVHIHNLWADPDFLPNGGTVAFGLQHAYPVKSDGWSENYSAFLKGSDRILHDVLLAHTNTVQLKAAYAVDAAAYDWDTAHQPGYAPCPVIDDFSPRWSYDPIRWGHIEKLLLTSDKFSGIPEGAFPYQESTDECGVLRRELGAVAQPDVIWCRRPGPPAAEEAAGGVEDDAKLVASRPFRPNRAYSMTSAYVRYGNEASIGYCYVAAALVAQIPTVAERTA